MRDLILLKLGGSLITDKHSISSPRREVLQRLAEEIAAARSQSDVRIILGHGSGSFGHVPASRYGTRDGVRSKEQWRGFIEVWKEARVLNQLVLDALLEAGLPAISLPPSAAATAFDGLVYRWEIGPLKAALEAGLLPVINGDTLFDMQRGGTILSTEDLFAYLASIFHPKTILLAGLEEGVWQDFPACTKLVRSLGSRDYAKIAPGLQGSAATDVTGGMLQKVTSMLTLVASEPDLSAVIFSGQQPHNLYHAILGQFPGTVIHA